MKNRLSKTLEKKILADIEPELLAGIEHFLNEHTKRCIIAENIMKQKALEDDWNPDWGTNPCA